MRRGRIAAAVLLLLFCPSLEGLQWRSASLLSRRLRLPRRPSATRDPLLEGGADPPAREAVSARPAPQALGAGFPAQEREGAFTKRDIIRHMVSFVWPRGEPRTKLLVVGSVICLVAGKYVSVRVPLLLQRAIDAMAAGGSPAAAGAMAPGAVLVCYGAARVLATVFQELKTTLFARVSQSAVRRFAASVFRHLHALDTSFHLRHPTGTLSVAYVRGTRGFQSILFQMVFSVVPTLVELSLSGWLLASRCGTPFAATTLGMFAVYTAFTAKLTEWRVRIRRRLVTVDNARNAYFVDSLMNHETVKLFGGEDWELRRYESRYLRRIEKANLRNTLSIACLNVGQALLFSMGLTACMLLSLQGVRSGAMGVGDLVAVNGILLQLSVPFNFVGFTYQELRQGFVDLEYTMSVLARRPAVSEPAPSAAAPLPRPLRGRVELEGVTFRYPNTEELALRDVSLSVQPGQRVAIVGPSGSGKSTLLKLITRLYDPAEGRVRLDGVDVSRVPVRDLRDAVGVVAQENSLFDDSVRGNVAYGRPSASEEDLWAAARAARLDKAVERMADGMETPVGERGGALSGGERQRVAIARALLKEPDLLLCDEITSAVDSFTEAEILESLRDASEGRTVITVAHRLQSVMDADLIFVLRHGRLMEKGTHEQLVSMDGGVYQAMWKAQNGRGWEPPAKAAKDAPEGDRAPPVELSEGAPEVQPRSPRSPEH